MARRAGYLDKTRTMNRLGMDGHLCYPQGNAGVAAPACLKTRPPLARAIFISERRGVVMSQQKEFEETDFLLLPIPEQIRRGREIIANRLSLEANQQPSPPSRSPLASQTTKQHPESIS